MNLYELVVYGLKPLNDFDINRIAYSYKETAIWLVGLMALVVLLKLLFSRNKFSQIGSGYLITDNGPSLPYRLLDLFLKAVAACGIGFLIFALAEPYISDIKTSIIPIMSRERIDLIDVSTSKGWEYLNTGKSAGEIGREGFLEFLKMRNGQNDRKALWVFSSQPRLVEDFTIDDNLYYQQAEDAPYIITSPDNPGLSQNDEDGMYTDVITPTDRMELIHGEGSTKLLAALEAVVRHIEVSGSKKIKQRALLIETDAAVEEYPEEQLKQLKSMNVNIYFLHIKPNKKAELEYRGGQEDLFNADLLEKQVEQYGGRFYDVTDRNSIIKAYQEISRLEAAPMEAVYTVDKVFFFQFFVLIGILTLIVTIAVVLTTVPFSIYP